MYTGSDNLALRVSSVEVQVGEEEFGRVKRKSGGGLNDPEWNLPTASIKNMYESAGSMEEALSVWLMRAEINAIEAQVDLGRHTRDREREKTRKLRSNIGKANDRESDTAVPEAVQEETGASSTARSDAQERLTAIEAEIAKCEATIRRADVLRRQHEFLSTHVVGTHDEDVLKKVSFWQNIINYLLYAVFTCNAFITGLGVSGGQDTSSGGN